MSFEIAKAYLDARGLGSRVMTFTQSSATVELAARAAGVEEARICKTLCFGVDGRCVLVGAAGDARIDNHKFKAYFHAKATLLSANDTLLRTGHAVGGVCPFGVGADVEVYLDVSLKRFDRVYPACGDDASAVPLAPDEFFDCARARDWIDVCKDYQ